MADNDQNTDVNAPVDENMDLGAAFLEESTSSTESSTEQTKETPAADESSEKTDESAESKDTEEDSEDSDEKSDEEKPDETKDEDKPKRDAEARKQTLNTQIRELVARKKQLETEVAERNSKFYRTETQEELVANGMDPEQAEYEAYRQASEMDKFNRDVTDLNQTIDLQVAQVMSDFPWADPQGPEYDEATAKTAYELFQKAGQPVIDEKTGYITNINVMPYDIYSAFDATRKSSTESGAVQGQKASEKMLAAAEPRSSAQAPAAEGDEDDPFLQGFNKVK